MAYLLATLLMLKSMIGMATTMLARINGVDEEQMDKVLDVLNIKV